ncbi:MAG TPA: MEDS domain-containing protein [Nitrososphaeraceae archaeon]|nr:MEDS domain-containing protein [Nitrososphaeraceae archaeon]
MSIKDSSALFQQPLNFVHQIEEGKHIVLFYEELEYAKMISFQFIRNGLSRRKDCSYLSEEEIESVGREMSDSGVDVKKFTKNNQLHIYQVSSLTDYNPRDSPNGQTELIGVDWEHKAADDTAILKNPSKIKESDRIVLRCVYNVNTEEQIKSNLKWEHDYRFKNLKDTRTTVVCTYPVNDIIPTISDSIGSYGKWMNTLLELYDGVIFARRFWKGVAFNLD